MAEFVDEQGQPNNYEEGQNGANGDVETALEEHQTTAEEEAPFSLDIVICNVVCTFSVGCHLNLRQVALLGINVEFKKDKGMVAMKLRNPYSTASMWSSGKITCTGATSEENSKKAARRFSRILEKLGFKVRLRNYKVVNVLGTCIMPFAIRLNQFSEQFPNASYEPELHPAVTFRIVDPKATLKIFSTGSITITAPSVLNVQLAVEYIFPLVYQHQRALTEEEKEKRDVQAELKEYNSRIKERKRRQYTKEVRKKRRGKGVQGASKSKRSKRDSSSSESDTDTEEDEDENLEIDEHCDRVKRRPHVLTQ